MTTLEVLRDGDLGIDAPERIARPVMVQRWMRLSFLHWRFDPDVVQRLLPASLEVDRFDGGAWIGVIPFDLAVRCPPWFPSIPGLSETAEVNVRTYVRGPDGRRGIWFLSLDAAALPAVALARAWYRLPYRRARFRVAREGDRVGYQSVRRTRHGRDVRFSARLAIGTDPETWTPLDRFLTCRWRLYSPGARRIMVTAVEHPPWPIFAARVLEMECGLLEPLGLGRPSEAPRALFSPGVTARFGKRLPARRSQALTR